MNCGFAHIIIIISKQQLWTSRKEIVHKGNGGGKHNSVSVGVWMDGVGGGALDSKFLEGK